MQKKIIFLRRYSILGVLLLLIYSCGKQEVSPKAAFITHYPVFENKNVGWKLMDIKTGKTLENSGNTGGVITPVTDGCFFARLDNGTWELYNINNPQKRIEGNYVSVGAFNEGVAPVTKKDEEISYINKEGKTIFKLPYNYLRAGNFSNERAIVMDDCDKIGFINMKGETVIPPQYDIALPFYNGYALVGDENDIFYINKSGEKVLPINDANNSQYIMDNLTMWTRLTENELVPYVTSGNMLGIKDLKGNIVLEASSKYKNIAPMGAGNITVETDNGCGIIDRKGKFIVKDSYDRILYCDNKCFITIKNGKCGIVSIDEEILCPFKFDSIFAISGSSYFIALLNKKILIISQRGEVINSYDDIIPSVNSYAESNSKKYREILQDKQQEIARKDSIEIARKIESGEQWW